VSRRKKVRERSEQFVARVCRLETSYFLSLEDPLKETPADEEAIIFRTAVVRWISRRHKQHLGRPFEVNLITSERFGDRGSANRYFGSISLKKSQCGAYVNLPALSFYALPSLLDLEDCLVDLDFEPTKWGYGELRSISITNSRQLLALPGFPGDELIGDPMPV
jgi:hypothetical protein